VFGALVSPTDPIAVLGILKSAGASPAMTAKITGESLFNDGVGLVVFTALAAIAFGGGGHGAPDAAGIAELFVQEVVGGIGLGLAAGYAAFHLLKGVDDHALEVLITVALVLGSYALCHALHLSGPLAVVVAGLFVGNHATRFAMSDESASHVTGFWTVSDELLNAVLFLLIGLELLAISLDSRYLIAGLIAIPVCLLARLLSVAIPISLLGLGRDYQKGTIPVLTWAGLKGGISVALVLSLPPFPHKDLLLTCTYLVVLFSIVVQGLTVGRLVARMRRADAA
jgi:CPA1 family monovalent cation:H+ antiporter